MELGVGTLDHIVKGAWELEVDIKYGSKAKAFSK